MKQVNLIPQSILDARRKRLINRRWVKGTLTYCLVIVVATLISRLFTIDPGIAIAKKIDQTQSKITQHKTQLVGLKSELGVAQNSMIANLKLQAQPNWSVLLRIVASQMASELVLTRCDLIPIYPPNTAQTNTPGHPQSTEPQGYDFVIEGQAKTMTAINQFALRLERTGVFEQVKLEESHQGVFVKQKSNFFRFKCSLKSEERF